MERFNRICLFVLIVALVTACSPATTPIPPVATENNPSAMSTIPSIIHVQNPYAPQAVDNAMMRGDISIDSSSLTVTKSVPLQVTLNIAYVPPTPCFQLRMDVSQPDAQNRINVSAYAVAEKDKACALMAPATALQANLDLGSFPKGHYSVWLNDVKVDEFDS